MTSNSGKVAWNTILQVGGKIVAASIGLLITIFLTRYLGPSGYGDYTFVIVFVTMFGAIADWGLSIVGVSETSKHPENEQGRVVGNVLLIRLGLAIFAMLAANIAIRILPHSPGLESLILIGSIFIFIFSLKTSFQIIFNARLRMEYWAISEIVVNVSGLLLVLFLISQGAGLTGFVWAISFGQLVATFVAFVFARHLVRFDLRIQKDLVRKIFKETLPVGSLLVLFTVYNHLDIVVLGYFKGAAAVGYYGASYKVYEVLVLGAAYFANSILPILSNLAHKDEAVFKRVFVKSFVVLAVLGLGVSIANFILAPIAIAVIGGPEYQPSVLALQILSLALFVSYFNHLGGYAIIALSKQWLSFLVAIVALVLNLVLNLILIPKYSLYGAAFNTFLTEAIILILSLYVLRRFGGVRFGPRDIFYAGMEIFNERERLLKFLRK